MAAPARPSALTPSGTTMSGHPVLSWARVSGAAEYEVQLDNENSFGSPLVALTTTNRRATPTENLPTGHLWWRVRGVSSTGVRGSWALASFEVGDHAAPSLVSPGNGAPLQQPDEPVLLTWTPAQGAIGYTIEVDDDDRFLTPSGTYTSSLTSFLLPDPGLEQTYYWHVRANFSGNISSRWSAPNNFTVLGLAAPALTAPDDSATSQVTDAVLDWKPVAGAVKYEVQVSTDQEFNSFDDKIEVKSTRYARPVTLNNDQYWWRVRAVDVNGNQSPWTRSLNQFQRHWPQSPTLLHPTEGSEVSSPFYYEWDPVPNASHYELQVGVDPNFSPGSYSSCSTKATTYTTRFGGDKCHPSMGAVTYWRVRGLDGPHSPAVNGIWSEIHSFIFSPGLVHKSSPTSGAVVDVPTLRWASFNEAEAYRVVVKKASGGSAAQATTFATSWTPTQRLDPDDGPFTWTVQALGDAGQPISQLPLFDTHSFDLTGVVDDTGLPALQPTAPLNGHQSTRFPELTWEPFFAGGTPAAYYKVFVGPAGSGSFFTLGSNFPYASATDHTAQFLAPGNYEWFVQPFASNGAPLDARGPSSTFVITNLASASGHGASLTGTGLESPTTTCENYLDNSTQQQQICTGLLQTPVLEWDSVSNAAYYMVYVSRDRQLTNLVYNPVTNAKARTSNTFWTPQELLADSQAGDAYYWVIRPCKATGYCAPDPTEATHAFDKRSLPVQDLTVTQHEEDAPVLASPSAFADEVVLSWANYLDATPSTFDQMTGLPSGVEARNYRVDISSDESFAHNAQFKHTSPLLDQTSYSPYLTTLPEGPLYWRVQALDGSGNALTYSSTMTLEKRSPRVILGSPKAGSIVSRTPFFQWQPQEYAARYEIEVYKNGDTTFSVANRVISGTTEQAAFTANTVLLPASGSPYVWRVRRIDVDNRPGGWSPVNKTTEDGVFTVRAFVPPVVSPQAGAYVSARDSLFTWKSVQAATTYRFERRAAGATSISESVTTVGLAWAPDKEIANGRYEWRVSAYDSKGALLGSSAWRGFRVDATKPRIVKRTPLRTASRNANFVVTFSEPVRGVGTTTMALSAKGQQHRLSATVRMSNGNRTATLNPARNLQIGRTYTIRLLNGIKDAAGNPLSKQSWTVTVR
jgi:hypothetical protein